MTSTGQHRDKYGVNSLVFTPEFDLKGNVYRDLKGNAMLSVSEVVGPVFNITYKLNQELESGVHVLIERYIENNNSLPTIRSDCFAYIEAFTNWWKETRPDNKYIRKSLACARFAGTLDFFGKINGEVWVIEWTTQRLYPCMGVQLAAYAMLLQGYLEQLTGKIEQIHRGALQLSTDGTYIFKKYENLEDYEIFNCLLTLKRWQMANKSF